MRHSAYVGINNCISKCDWIRFIFIESNDNKRDEPFINSIRMLVAASALMRLCALLAAIGAFFSLVNLTWFSEEIRCDSYVSLINKDVIRIRINDELIFRIE